MTGGWPAGRDVTQLRANPSIFPDKKRGYKFPSTFYTEFHFFLKPRGFFNGKCYWRSTSSNLRRNIWRTGMPVHRTSEMSCKFDVDCFTFASRPRRPVSPCQFLPQKASVEWRKFSSLSISLHCRKFFQEISVLITHKTKGKAIAYTVKKMEKKGKKRGKKGWKIKIFEFSEVLAVVQKRKSPFENFLSETLLQKYRQWNDRNIFPYSVRNTRRHDVLKHFQ